MKKVNSTIHTILLSAMILSQSNILLSMGLADDTSNLKLYNNPIIASRGVCDPHIHIFNNKAWLFATHDEKPGNTTYVMNDWWIWSSSDLVHWNLEYTLKPQDMWVGATTTCWAVDGAERNGKNYFFVSGHFKTSVAVSNSGPSGPYTDTLKTYIVGSYDPTVFVDDDVNKTPYLITGYFPYKIARLNEDMISLAETPKDIVTDTVMPKPGDGNFIHKHNGIYYLNGHGTAYWTATNIYGPYKRRSNAFYKSWVDHPTMFSWNNQTYCAYGLGDNDQFFRKTHITYMHYKTNGDMVADDYVANSFIGVGQYDCSNKIEAEWYFAASDSIRKTENGTSFIMKNITNNAFLYYPRILNVAQNPTITINLASVNGGDTIEIRKDSTNGVLLGTVIIPATGSITNYQTASAVLNCNSGINNIYFVFKGNGSFASIDWFTLTSTGALLAPCLPSPAAASVNAYQQVEAENFICNYNLQSETCSDIGGGKNIGYIRNMSSCSYKLDFGINQTDSIPLQLRVASSNSNGCTIELRLDSKTGPLIGVLKVPGTGGFQTWMTRDFNIAAPSGVHILHFIFKGGDGYLMNMNWFKFTSKTSRINLSAMGCTGSSVSGDGAYVNGDSVRVTANPARGCLFVNWTENGVEQSKNPVYSFVASLNRSLQANFKNNTSQISLLANGCTGSTVSGGGTIPNGDTVNASATPAAGCVFVSWIENGIEQSNNQNYNFITNGNRTLIGYFKKSYQITLSANGCSGSTVTGGGTVVAGDSVRVTANPAGGCRFVNWTVNGMEQSKDLIYAFLASQNRDLTANFTASTGLVNVSKDIRIYPNPVSKTLNIEFPENVGERKINIVNLFGQVVYTQQMNDSKNVLDVQSFRLKGIFFLQVLTENKVLYFSILAE